MALRALRRAAISYGQHAWPYRIGSDLRICTSSTSRCLSDIPGEDQEQQEQHKQGKQQKSKADGERVLLHGVHDLPAAPQGIVELREYQLQPASLKPYLQVNLLCMPQMSGVMQFESLQNALLDHAL